MDRIPGDVSWKINCVPSAWKPRENGWIFRKVVTRAQREQRTSEVWRDQKRQRRGKNKSGNMYDCVCVKQFTRERRELDPVLEREERRGLGFLLNMYGRLGLGRLLKWKRGVGLVLSLNGKRGVGLAPSRR